jgi:DNA-binding CsgD family transcriptional regulator/PAS domain-containing protein
MRRQAATGLGERDLQRSLAFLQRRRAEAPSLDRFAQSAAADLAQLVGADLVTLSYCDLRAGTRSVVTWPERSLGARDVACFNRFFHVHPLVRYHANHPEAGAHRISDSEPWARFSQSALYVEYYRSIGIDHVVAVPVHIDAQRVVSFVLNRSRRDFSDRDRDLLDTLRFQLGAEYTAQEARLRTRRSLAQLNDMLVAAGLAVVVLDRDRRVRQGSDEALKWLAYAGLEGRVRCGELLPEPIDGWIRARVEPSWAMVDTGPLTLATAAHALHLHLLQADGMLTLLIETEPSGKAEKGAYGLTAREREVLRWITAGKSNAAIAGIIGIRPRTVQKHLERIYCKLGVENRTAAAMRGLKLLRESG